MDNRSMEGNRLVDADFCAQMLLLSKRIAQGLEKYRRNNALGIIPRLNKVRAFDVSLHKSKDYYQLVEEGCFKKLQSRMNNKSLAQKCETFRSNRR